MTTTHTEFQLGAKAIHFADYMAMGLRAAVIGSSGSGKSHTCRVLCEEALSAGIPCIVIDPEGEYYSLGEHFPVVIVGGPQAHVPLPATAEYAGKLVDLALSRPGLATVLDLQELATFQQQDTFTLFCNELFLRKKADSGLALVVIEEAELFAPEGAKGDSLQTAEHIAKRGRKRALWSVWAPHRSADFSKRVLSQCNLPIIGRLDALRDFKAVSFMLPEGTAYQSVRGLPPGNFMMGNGDVVKVQQSLTTHVSDSSRVEVRLTPPSDDLAEAVRALAQSARVKDTPSATTTAKEQPVQWRENPVNVGMQQRVRELEEQVKTLTADAAVGKRFKELVRDIGGVTPAVGNASPVVKVVKAPEAIRSQHVKSVVERLTGQIDALPTEQRGILRMLMAVGKATRQDLAVNVTGIGDKQFTGQAVARWHQQFLTPLNTAGWISIQQKESTVFYRLPELVKTDLQVFSATDDELRQAIEALEHVLVLSPK